MSTITIEMPEWAEKRHIYVFAGVELLAYQYAGEKLRAKTGRCSMCGKCCIFRDGPCEHLVPDGTEKMICSLGSGRPFSCSVSNGTTRVPECTEVFEDR